MSRVRGLVSAATATALIVATACSSSDESEGADAGQFREMVTEIRDDYVDTVNDAQVALNLAAEDATNADALDELDGATERLAELASSLESLDTPEQVAVTVANLVDGVEQMALLIDTAEVNLSTENSTAAERRRLANTASGGITALKSATRALFIALSDLVATL